MVMETTGYFGGRWAVIGFDGFMTGGLSTKSSLYPKKFTQI